MLENLLHLLPGLILQFLLATALLWLFIRPSDEVPAVRVLLTALIFCLLNPAIEWTLRDFLMEATLVIQWALFVLLANHFLSIPLPRAALTLFCFFALMLGAGLLGGTFASRELSEEERLLLEGFEAVEVADSDESGDPALWALRLRSGILDKRLMTARSIALRSLYPETETDPKPKSAAQPTPQTAPETVAEIETRPPATSMSGKEFEALFQTSTPAVATDNRVESSPEIAEPAERTTGTPEPPTHSREPDARPDRWNHPGGFNARQLSEAVKVRNRSTDRRYPNPQFDVGAVSMGEQGRFAIVDGEMLTEGSIIRTNREDPRGWKLHRIEAAELFWQPLK